MEAATGQTLEQELDQRIFRRLKLTGTSFPIGLAFPGSYAHGYIGRATLPGTSGLIDISGLLNPTWLWAAGAIVSSGDDVTRFYAALLGGRLLPPSLLAAMRRISPQSPGLPYDYGLGLMRFGTACALAYGHIGDYNGYRTIVYGRRNGKRVAVVMVNIDLTHVSWPQLEAATESAFCST